MASLRLPSSDVGNVVGVFRILGQPIALAIRAEREDVEIGVNAHAGLVVLIDGFATQSIAIRLIPRVNDGVTLAFQSLAAGGLARNLNLNAGNTLLTLLDLVLSMILSCSQ